MCALNKDAFIKLPPSKRVEEVNKLLQDHDLKKISSLIGIPSSSFSKLMWEGDYIYHQADKRYYPFVRSKADRLNTATNIDSDEIAFIKRHMDTLKKIVQNAEKSDPLILDKRIYNQNAQIMNKNIRMNNDIYQEFTSFCKQHYPHLKIQDVFSQSLLDAMQKYQPENY